MNGTLRRAMEQFRAMWAGLSAGQRAVVGLLALALAAAVAWGVSAAGAVGEQMLVGPNTPPDVQEQVRARLADIGFPYRIRDGGIYVPADQAGEAWLQIQSVLNGVSLPEPSIFDTQSQTEQRRMAGLQANLARSIRNLKGIERAQVQLVSPQRIGLRETIPGSAVVTVELKPGVEVTRSLVNSIAQLVAAGSGVKTENVTIGTPGGVFQGGDSDTLAASDLHDQALVMGRKIAQEVQKLLTIEARVMATPKLSAKRVEEERTTSGAPRVQSEDGQKVEYFVPTEKVKSFTPAGAELVSLSVSVVIPERAPVPTEEARRAEFLSRIRSIVRSATGIQDDQFISVETIPVVEPAPAAEPAGWERAWDALGSHAGQIGLVLLMIVLAVGLWKILRAAVDRVPSVSVEESARPAGQAITEEARLREAVSEAVLKEPREAAEVVRRLMER
ncbi:MAG: hypothetical protein HYY16_18785 [Planctomycetes bacterium]|nr:hypothetical protein [Planctomycetota bacterium]